MAFALAQSRTQLSVVAGASRRANSGYHANASRAAALVEQPFEAWDWLLGHLAVLVHEENHSPSGEAANPAMLRPTDAGGCRAVR